MNKSIKKCCICSNSETGEFIMIGDNKYHLSCIEKMQKEKQELIEYLKEEQDRLARECSHIYEDSLGRTRLVSKDIYNEVSKILSKIEKSDK